jgi:hypothetical protein
MAADDEQIETYVESVEPLVAASTRAAVAESLYFATNVMMFLTLQESLKIC